MENLDVIILTLVVVVSFVVFIVTSVQEFNRMEEEPWKYEEASGPTRAALFNALSSLLDEEGNTEKKRNRSKGPLKRTISDMDTDGVHFDEKPKKNMEKDKKKKGPKDKKKD